MQFKKIVFLLGFHIITFILGTILFIFIFRSPVLTDVEVMFYRGVSILLVTTLVIVVILTLIKRSKFGDKLSYYDVILACVVFVSVNTLFFTHIPVTADRSLTVFMLGIMNQDRDRQFSITDMEKIFIEGYLIDNDNLHKRFEEQLISGNIEKGQEGFVITENGVSLVKFYSLIADIFLIHKKNLSL